MRDGVEVISRRMVQRAESPLLFSAVLISAAVRSAQAGRETSTLPWIWKLALISDLGTPENLPCSPVSHPRSPPASHVAAPGRWGRNPCQLPLCRCQMFLDTPAPLSRVLSVIPAGRSGTFLCQAPSSLRDLSPLSGSLPLSGMPLLPSPLSPRFPSLRAAALRALSLPAAASVSCLFPSWTIRDVPLLFTPGVTNLYSQSILGAAGKQQASDRKLEGSGLDVRLPKHKPLASLHNFSQFFACESSVTNTIYPGVSSRACHALPCLCVHATFLLFGSISSEVNLGCRTMVCCERESRTEPGFKSCVGEERLMVLDLLLWPDGHVVQ